MLTLWSLTHLSIVLTFISFVAINHQKMLYAETSIGKINDVLVYFSLLLAHTSIVIETFAKRRYFVKYWDHYEKIMRIGKPFKRTNWQHKLLVKIILFVLFTIIIESLVITNITQDKQWTNFWYAEIFSLIMTRIRHIQHIFFIDIIFFTLQDMNCHLRNSILWTKAIGESKMSRKFLYTNISKTKEQMKNLMEMLICVNRIFCWSQVINVGQQFVEVTSELYWVYAFGTNSEFLWREEFKFHRK